MGNGTERNRLEWWAAKRYATEEYVTQGMMDACEEFGHVNDGPDPQLCARCNTVQDFNPEQIATKPRRPLLTSREVARVGREHTRRFPRDTERTRAEYRAQLHAIATELYPDKRYPGAIA